MNSVRSAQKLKRTIKCNNGNGKKEKKFHIINDVYKSSDNTNINRLIETS